MQNFLCACLVLCSLPALSSPDVLPMRERALLIDELLNDKLEKTLPGLMQRNNIDMWVVISREYNEDPIIETLFPATWLAARRRTILVMYQPEGRKSLETLAVARYAVGKRFTRAWDKKLQPDQWARLAEIIVERDPQRIGINQSEHWGLADGLVSTDLQWLRESLPQRYQDRIVSAETLGVAWLETRTERELQIYPSIVRMAHDIIAEAFSSRVVQPGVTTTDDVVWWLRERVRELKLSTWFHPSVGIQRADVSHVDPEAAFAGDRDDHIIHPGDLLHIDFGINYLRLNTDTQQHAYVLRPGETDAPDYLKQALAAANRLQDIFTNTFEEGATGNEVLARARQQAIEEGIRPSIYTHPLGYHVHGAGPTLGMWDSQGGVPGSGDYPLHLDTVYAIELNAATFVEEWGKDIRIMLEEDAVFDKNGVHYLDGRQTELLLIPRQVN